MTTTELDNIYKTISQNKNLSIDSLPPVVLPSDGKFPETEITVTESGILIPKQVKFWKKWPIQNEDSIFFVNFFYYNNAYKERFFGAIRFDDECSNCKIWVEDFISDRYLKSFSLDFTDPLVCPDNLIELVSSSWEKYGSYDHMVYNEFVPRVDWECFNYTFQIDNKSMTIVDFGGCLNFSNILHDIFSQFALLYIRSTCRGFLYNFRNYYSGGIFSEEHLALEDVWPKKIEL